MLELGKKLSQFFIVAFQLIPQFTQAPPHMHLVCEECDRCYNEYTKGNPHDAVDRDYREQIATPCFASGARTQWQAVAPMRRTGCRFAFSTTALAKSFQFSSAVIPNLM